MQEKLQSLSTQDLKILHEQTERSLSDLRELRASIEGILFERSGKTLGDLPTEVQEALRDGKRIRAIKEMRKYVPSIREARNLVYAALGETP